MARWIQHWQTLPVQNRIGATLCMAALVVIIVSLVIQINGLVTDIYHAMGATKRRRRPGNASGGGCYGLGKQNSRSERQVDYGQ